jgi:hypothetical protein
VFLWFRVLSSDGTTFSGDTWELKDPNSPDITNCPSSGCEFAGTFTVTLAPGQVWEGRIYLQEESNPNAPVTKEEPVARLAIPAIAKPPSAQDLIGNLDRGVGGTFFMMAVNTPEPTFCRIQVGRTAPEEGPDGVVRLRAPLHTVFDDLVPFGVNHNLLVESFERSIMPGNEFHALVLAMDAFGNWDVHTETFTTRLRTVTIDFDEIHIVNDGVPGDGVGHFSISVSVFPGPLPEVICAFGPMDISDRPDPGEEFKEHIPLADRCPRFVLPPTQVTNPNFHVALETRGRVETTFGQDDIARNFREEIPFPEGIREEVQDRPFQTTAFPEDSDDEFTYAVKTRVTVEYVES